MWRLSKADGGGVMYGTNYGWPFEYLRVPEGEYSHVPVDWFAPGLMANAAIVILGIAVLRVVWWKLCHHRPKDLRNHRMRQRTGGQLSGIDA